MKKIRYFVWYTNHSVNPNIFDITFSTYLDISNFEKHLLDDNPEVEYYVSREK